MTGSGESSVPTLPRKKWTLFLLTDHSYRCKKIDAAFMTGKGIEIYFFLGWKSWISGIVSNSHSYAILPSTSQAAFYDLHFGRWKKKQENVWGTGSSLSTKVYKGGHSKFAIHNERYLLRFLSSVLFCRKELVASNLLFLFLTLFSR